MSKSLGNSPDPLDLIDKYGADALRFSIMRIAPSGTDVRFIENRKKNKESGEETSECPQVEEGRNFANKLWNACRFRQLQGDNSGSPAGSIRDQLESLSIYDLDILARLDALSADLKRAYEGYKFQEIATRLYDFFWSGFCDWYLESIKRHLRDGVDPQIRSRTLLVFDTVLARYLPLLHPFMPHITEELWEKLGFAADGELLMRTMLPADTLLEGISQERLDAAQQRTSAVHEATGRARHIKAQYNLAANRNVKFFLEPAVDWVAEELDTLELLCGAGEIDATGGYRAAAGTPAFLTPLGKMYMPLEGLVDIKAEQARINKEMTRMKEDLDRIGTKLANAKFVERAPKEVVEENRQRRESLKMSIEQLEEMLKSLS